jgi:formyltetrahydrofolate deformylase
MQQEFILTLSCPDQRGIVHRVSGFLVEQGCNILDSAQYGDLQSDTYFMRIHFAAETPEHSLDGLRTAFAPVAEAMHMKWEMHDAHHKPRVVIFVSRIGHCLNDCCSATAAVCCRWRFAQLFPITLTFISWRQVTIFRFIIFLPAGANDAQKQAQEARILEVLAQHQTELVVLARYMQILSASMCQALEGRAINIHHSFLPSFKGAKPYYQAHERGVKLIGATAHFVTTDLDEGPIIEQDVERVDHAMTPEELTAIGRDVECVVLARAVKWFVEHRILLNGHKTVVFR